MKIALTKWKLGFSLKQIFTKSYLLFITQNCVCHMILILGYTLLKMNPNLEDQILHLVPKMY